MSLPTGEQRILDGIAERLRVSEPRLASMFSIFGRLCRNDAPPPREQLPPAGSIRRLAAIRRRDQSRRAVRPDWVTRPPPGRQGPQSRRHQIGQVAFLIANVAVAVAVTCILIAVNVHQGRSCAMRPARSTAVLDVRGVNCPAQAGHGGSQGR